MGMGRRASVSAMLGRSNQVDKDMAAAIEAAQVSHLLIYQPPACSTDEPSPDLSTAGMFY